MQEHIDHSINDPISGRELTLSPQGVGVVGLETVPPPVPYSIQDSPEQSRSIRILRLPDVIARVGLKRGSIYLHINKGIFPRPISLGPRSVGWIEHEIDAWLAERILKRSK